MSVLRTEGEANDIQVQDHRSTGDLRGQFKTSKPSLLCYRRLVVDLVDIIKSTIINPAGAGPPRHLPAAGGGGHKVAPFTSVTISSEREEIEKRNFAHIFLNT